MRRQLGEHAQRLGKRKVSVNDLIIKAAALALRQHPEVNQSFEGGPEPSLWRHEQVNIGVAVASEHGLVVPVVHNADVKSVGAIGAEVRHLAGLAGDRKLTPEQMSGGTFTVSNLGMFGVDQFEAIINPPESAILAVGAIQTEARFQDGVAVPARVAKLTLTADHRVVDGALAAQFLGTLGQVLENPWGLVL
jgi:pyruvate dehydrogenase E2 component (dihydrolipoamide acetyltransferase)